MPHLRLSFAILALSGAAACGQEEAPSDTRPTKVVEIDPVQNASAPPAAREVVAAESAVPNAPEPRPTRDPDVSDEAVRAEITPMLAACLETGDAGNGVSAAMGGCFNAELRRQDVRLNDAYQAAMKRLGTTGKAWLRDEERKWIVQRDKSCEAERTGGTIDLVEVPSCMVDETIRRTIVLQGMAG